MQVFHPCPRPLKSAWFCSALVCLASCAVTVEAASTSASGVFTDPKHDPSNPLRYIASNVLTGITIALVLSVAIVQTCLMWQYGGRCMLSMLIGEFAWAIGFAVRFTLHSDPDSQAKYIVYDLFIILSPCAFIASEYMLLGRIARHARSDELLAIRPQKITKVFVISDISTFLIQAAGASLSISKTLHVAKTGEHIFLAGLALQLASFSLFMGVALFFLFRVKTKKPEIWYMDAHAPWHQDWRVLSLALLVSSVGVFIRCFYRVIELAQGYHGHLATTEVFFYTLDTLPLFLATAIYAPFWPGRMVPEIDSDQLGKVDHIDDAAKETRNGGNEYVTA